MKVSLGLVLLIIVVLSLVYGRHYMFITALSSPTTMDLYMPRDSEDDANKYSLMTNKLTLILLKDEKVFGYYKDDIGRGRSVSLDETDEMIADGWKMFSKDSLVVIIKPSKEATYKTTVGILDKMSANQIEKYTMADPDKKEKEFLKLDE